MLQNMVARKIKEIETMMFFELSLVSLPTKTELAFILFKD